MTSFHRYLAEEVAVDHAAGLIPRHEALHRLNLLGLAAPAADALLAAWGTGGQNTAAPATTTSGTENRSTPITTASGRGDAATQAAAGTGGGSGTATASAASPGGASPAGPSPLPTEEIIFPGTESGVTLRGAWAAPAAPRGAVLVIHENRGLTDHIRSVAGRLAADGYCALAVDLLSREGGTASFEDPAGATAALGAISPERLALDMKAALGELERGAPGKGLGVVGFCFGGAMTWLLLSSDEPRLSAAVPFYGPLPGDADLSGSRAAVLAIYAERDGRVNATRDEARTALERAGLEHEIVTFPGVDHAFFNDTGPRYDAGAAAEAYRRALDWFGRHLA
ncbi:dienelactone hydrolase family protein [Streptosporangium sp. NPDC048865]|uniref:dienelactone hydrolase family protein n=1 Tax=Streptosporangium sp. NPDC048865 TaxID=3155766 RepID=UPI0034300DB5